MTSPVDQSCNSTGRRIPLSIKPEIMLNTHCIMKLLWSPTLADQGRNRKVQFDIDNSGKARSKIHCVIASAKGLLQEAQLQKCRMVFEEDNQDEL